MTFSFYSNMFGLRHVPSKPVQHWNNLSVCCCRSFARLDRELGESHFLGIAKLPTLPASRGHAIMPPSRLPKYAFHLLTFLDFPRTTYRRSCSRRKTFALGKALRSEPTRRLLGARCLLKLNHVSHISLLRFMFGYVNKTVLRT